MNKTVWRNFIYEELKTVTLHGSVLDLGGSKKSGYHEIIQGKHTIEVGNIDPDYGFDKHINAEYPFPIEDQSYDGILCINVMEHVYNYRNLLSESHRILKKNGTIVIAVPFLIQVHPCPHDYWRFTGETLEKILLEAGFRDVKVKAMGRGVFTAISQLLHNVLHFGVLRSLAVLKGRLLDGLLKKLRLHRYSSPEYFPLGYFVTARK